MHIPPAELSRGDHFTKEEIEAAFDTGFGYQISGINPRRDDQEERYILVFATEDGPYDDSVTQGRFEYIGEGLEGDQSRSSPGNSALIDAISDPIPVYFFYQQGGNGAWEYQGLVDVQEYGTRVHDDRTVLVFTMEHRKGGSPPTMDESTDEELTWREALRLELERYRDEHDERIVTLSELYEFAEQRLAARFPANNHVRARIRESLQELRDQGDVEFVDGQGTYRINVGNEVQREKTALRHNLDSEPQLTGDTDQFTASRRRARDHAFAELVKEVYDYTCAICGRSRETPSGNPEVEAAHIYPKREGGADDIRNGIALCKLHHWAFDNGWLSLSNDHEILVNSAQDKNGYHEFKQLEGHSLQLPDSPQFSPHQLYLGSHRDIHGF